MTFWWDKKKILDEVKYVLTSAYTSTILSVINAIHFRAMSVSTHIVLNEVLLVFTVYRSKHLVFHDVSQQKQLLPR